MASSPASLTVVARDYCHLCEEMIAALYAAAPAGRLQLEVVDVDSDPGLQAKWGDRVPVLLDGGMELCHGRLDPSTLDALLSKIR